MRSLVVIPARYDSSRFPGKPLVNLRGCDGHARPLIQRTWEAAQQINGVDRIVIATDDSRIESACNQFGADVVMTSSLCKNGTERCAEVACVMPDYDVIVNLQGDAPLTPPWFIETLLETLNQTEAQVATPVLCCDAETLRALRADRKHGRVGATTAVFDNNGKGLYFSKEVLPFADNSSRAGTHTPVYHHVGVYAYRASALRQYSTWPTGNLEAAEGLEQLRFMENGVAVQCVPVDARGQAFWELNNPEDIARIESILDMQKMP